MDDAIGTPTFANSAQRPEGRRGDLIDQPGGARFPHALLPGADLFAGCRLVGDRA